LVVTAVIPFIYGSEYADSKKYILELIPAYFCNGLCQLFINFLYYREKAYIVSRCYVLSFFINLIMNWLLIPILGATGAAIGTIVAYVPCLTMLWLVSRKEWFEIRKRIEDF